jgi:hypothetical protein
MMRKSVQGEDDQRFSARGRMMKGWEIDESIYARGE